VVRVPVMLCCMIRENLVHGFATPEGTRNFSARFPEAERVGNFRQASGVKGFKDLWFSSIGMGSYLGETDAAADQLYQQAAVTAVRHGINVLDTAINYRHQRSERNFGEAIRELLKSGEVQRQDLIVCSKAGYLSFDGDVPADPRQYFTKEYIDTGIIKHSDVAGGMHCMASAYIADQIGRSRRNLGLETIDVFYLHNPETQLAEVAPPEFHARLKAAFATLEKAVAAGKIRSYGIASWNAFRVPQGEHGHMSLAECLSAARDVAGEDHHFRFVQIPFNLAMTEAYAAPNQPFGHELVSPLEFAAREGIAVIGSATLYQGQLTRNLPLRLHDCLEGTTDAQCAMQFARSAPGLLTALVGMGRPAHVLENLQVANRPMVPRDKWEALFSRDA
jgi:aryl-alcohol dehydrogenase-like predicted oxidoreductase